MDVLLPLRLLLNEALVERILATGRVVIWAGLVNGMASFGDGVLWHTLWLSFLLCAC